MQDQQAPNGGARRHTQHYIYRTAVQAILSVSIDVCEVNNFIEYLYEAAWRNSVI